MLAAYGQPEQGSFTLFANKVKDKAQWNRDIWKRAGSTAAQEEITGRKDLRSHLCPYVPFPWHVEPPWALHGLFGAKFCEFWSAELPLPNRTHLDEVDTPPQIQTLTPNLAESWERFCWQSNSCNSYQKINHFHLHALGLIKAWSETGGAKNLSGIQSNCISNLTRSKNNWKPLK